MKVLDEKKFSLTLLSLTNYPLGHFGTIKEILI